MDIALRRTGFDAWAALMLVGYAVVATALVAGAVVLLSGAVLVVVLIVLLLFWLFHSGVYVFAWTRMRKVMHPLGLHGDGLHARSQYGEVVAPWHTIQSVTLERAWSGRRLRIRLVPPADARRAEITSTTPPQVMKVLDKRGMRYSLRILDVDLEELRQAFVVQSAGRVQIS